MNSKLSSLLLAAALLLSASPAIAGTGGSAGQIRSAVSSGSVDAIVAEIERSEALICSECIDVMTGLLDHARYEVREAAGWWFAKRPSLKKLMVQQMVTDLAGTDAVSVRNAADFLGAVRAIEQLGALSAAYDRGVGVEARFAMVRAAAVIGSRAGSGLVTKALADADPSVRALAVASLRELRGQTAAGAAAIALLGDPDASVRAEAASTVGGFRDAAGRARLEALVVSDPDASVRRNAAWALGRLGQAASAAALEQASTDVSPLVRGVAKAARKALR
ncbi:MAG: HEAT repeat domain-containing protein [Kofleriaceae bacterium]